MRRSGVPSTVPSMILIGVCLSVCLASLLMGCAPKQAGFTQQTGATLTVKDKAAFRGGPMPASAREEMGKWIQRSQAKQKRTGTGPTAAEMAAARMK